MYGYLGATRAKASVGPKQQKCLAAGGSWEGPTGAKKCVMPSAGGVPTGATGGALPKAGSTVTGIMPPEWIGSEKKGAAGPKQAACTAQGGHWIGPEGKRWCQMVPGTVPASPVSKDTGLVDTAVVPPGSTPVDTTGSGLPGTTPPTTPSDYMLPGLITEATGGPSGAVYEQASVVSQYMSPRNLLLLGAAAVGGYFLWKRSKKGRKGGKRRR